VTQNIDRMNVTLFNKVPEITIYFWIVKIMATTVGGAGADFLIFNLKLGLTVTSILMSFVLAVILFMQISAKRYYPITYWITVVMISIVGTLVTDNLTDNFGVPLGFSTFVFSFCLATIFIVWYKSEQTLSIHSIFTMKREIFYWLAILFTFALGTAAGDLVAESLKLGYAVSAVIFLFIIIAIIASYYILKLNSVLAFWLAYILTRPFGASFGDYVSRPTKNGGLGFGTIDTSIVFLVIIILLVGFMKFSEARHSRLN
jgi:uncharacterized membrane-anchored protein